VSTRATETVIFLHIPKTAGTTLHRIIERQYPPTQVYSLDETHDFDDFSSLSEARRAELSVLKGHMIFGLHEYLPGPSAYFTLLREPADRSISNFHFVRRTPHHYHHDLIIAEKMTLKDYLESEVAPLMDNGQTRMLSGGWYTLPVGECTKEVLKAAKKNLQENFAVVGLTERFDETLLLLKERFGWHNIFYVRRNVSRDRPTTANLPAATRAVVEQYNQLDAELYRYVRMRFDEQVRHLGPAFARRVRSFQATNRLVTWSVGVYRQARTKSIRGFVRKQLQR
jgi:hypothetical protein